MTTREVLLKLSMLGLEVPTLYKYYRAIDSGYSLKRILNKDEYRRYVAQNEKDIKHNLNKQNINFVTINDHMYPKVLLNLYRPPVVIYYMGDLRLLKRAKIAIIGSRKYSENGKRSAVYLTKALVEHKMVIISGLAYGIDTIAHKTTINNQGQTIAVIGSGFNHIYPKCHTGLAKEIANNHLLVSEYPPNEPPTRTHFVFRNRIISALSDGVLVIEAKQKSGTMITVDYALNQGKQIYAVPSNLFEKNGEGTNQLIKEGAKVVTHVIDILEDFS